MYAVQGLIPFSNLADKCPNLDVTKIYELKSHIATNKPNVIILNITWLKETIIDNEILDANFYKMYRLDRSQKTHPIDPSNSKKFRKNGGGVLIVINNELILTSNVVNIKCRAELLATEFELSNKTTMIISNCYRVSTLGKENFNEISKAIKTLTRKRGIKKFILIGDLNLPHINWNTHSSSATLEQDFLDMFAENAPLQHVHTSTHQHDNILDLLLSSSGRFIENSNILKDAIVCKSDHFPITFDIKLKCKRSKGTKRKVYNYKKANWDRLNSELSQIDWTSLLNCLEPETAWEKFSNTLKYLMQRHIPVITVKSEFHLVWFDSECHKKM